MPRVYRSMGELKRTEHLTSVFTKAEKERIQEAARSKGVPTSILIHRAVISSLESAA